MSKFLILMYHMVAEPLTEREQRFACPPRLFARHMRFLRSGRFNLVGLEEIQEHLEGTHILPPESVAVTLDDGLGNRANVIAVEVLGVLFYQGNKKNYYGASLVYSSPSEGTFGYGAMAHVFRGISVGPIRQDRDADGTREWGWVLTLDAFDLFASIPKTLTDARALAAARN